MKTVDKLKIIMGFITFLGVINLSAQDITGSWNGILKVQSIEIPVVFHISKVNGLYTSTMDSPSQGAMGLSTDKTILKNDTLKIEMSKLGVVYEGTFDDELIKGVFTQGGMPIPLELVRGNYKQKKKFQEPTKPYPYLSEEVSFINSKANNIKLAGTLTLPKGVKNPPVAILITGSGAQNRNEEILGHKPFLVLSDFLTKKGIAVLRYDDRGVEKSEGNFSTATSFDFASDVEAAINYIKTRNDVINVNKIGLIGHSEGGMIAPIVASKNKDVSFIVLLAGPGITGKEVLITQTRKAFELNGISEKDIELNEKYSKKIYDVCLDYKGEKSKQKIIAIFNEMKNTSSEVIKAQLTNEAIQQQIKTITSLWMLTFIKFDPIEYLSKVNCPVLAINGAKDSQVLSKINLKGIEYGLKMANNKDVTINELEGLNHLFQTSKTGSFSEYASNKETFSPIALEIISDWIKARF
ncbi:MAG: alpha/beta hydrolase [Flavobacteriaceae bacterium]|nr:alpha/beta hydrolase [Flavobacteriaceae bacterium]